MKAFLLAAGKGTRMKPLTDSVPKCLHSIDHRPLLQIWLENLAEAGVSEVLINTHHLADQVESFARNLDGPAPAITIYHESLLMGSAGTVAANRQFIVDHDPFFIVYADNLTELPLREFLRFHSRRNSFFSVALFKPSNPRSCGIVTLDEDDRITSFVEKPLRAESPWANAGIYIADFRLFGFIESGKFADFGYDVLPRLVGKMYGFRYDGLFHDIGTPEQLERARRDWMRRNTAERKPC